MREPTAVETARLLLDAARVLGDTLEPQKVYERFRELVAGPIPHDGVVVSSYDPEEGLIRCEYAWIDGARVDPGVFPPVTFDANGGGMQSEVIRTGRPFRTNEVAARVRESGGTYYDVDGTGRVERVPEGGAPSTQALLMTPVTLEGTVVGVVQLHSDSTPYSDWQADLAEALVVQLAAAVRNARLVAARLEAEAREAAAQAVAAEREDAARVLEALGEGIVVVGDDGRIRIWNAGAERATGIARDRAIGRPPHEVVGGWESVAERVPVSSAAAPQRPTVLPVEISGREAWLSFVAVSGRIGRVYAVRDRTVEHRLEQARDAFVATISHEIRTPLTAVLGAATTLLRDDLALDEPARRELLEMIAGQASRLGGVADEVLLANRLDQGEIELETDLIDVDAVVRETLDAAGPGLPPDAAVRGVSGAAGQALGDRDRLQQVLLNLLDNAVKYSPAGGRVLVSTRRAEGRVEIAVADEGIGIAPAEQERIFEKFFRVDPSLRSGPGGTGLGLYISRALVERMGGTIVVASAPGAGSTFTVALSAPAFPNAPGR